MCYQKTFTNRPLSLKFNFPFFQTWYSRFMTRFCDFIRELLCYETHAITVHIIEYSKNFHKTSHGYSKLTFKYYNIPHLMSYL